MRYTNYKYSDGFNAVLEDAWLRTLGSDRKENTWRPQSWVPDLVAISIGRNDFNRWGWSPRCVCVRGGEGRGVRLQRLWGKVGASQPLRTARFPWYAPPQTHHPHARGEMSAASTSVQNGWGDSLGDFLNQLLQAYVAVLCVSAKAVWVRPPDNRTASKCCPRQPSYGDQGTTTRRSHGALPFMPKLT
jgi:hypothetical protein